MEAAFKKHVEDNFPFLKEKKILVAVSGGVDSIVLVHLFHQLGFEIALAHCNFQLRASESDGDHLFVHQLAADLKVPFHVIHFDTKAFAEAQKMSIQMAARKLRYDWFETIATENQLDYIATAHHADDNLETFLINMLRGTGLEGLNGIPICAEKRIRPLLPFSREQIVAYANENQIRWREDSSNASVKYLRNKLRHDVIPILKDINPNLLNNFKDTLHYLQQSQAIIDDAIIAVKTKVISSENYIIKIDLKQLQQLPNPKAYLYPILKPYGFTSWSDIHDLLEAQSGKQIFSDQYHMVKHQNTFLIQPKSQNNNTETYFLDVEKKEITNPIHLTWEKTSDREVQNDLSICIDADKISDLQLRKWQDGDVFYPIGMNGNKKRVSKYFKDQKMSLFQKKATWLLCAGDQIVWIIGKREDDRFKINEATTNFLKIKYHEY